MSFGQALAPAPAPVSAALDFLGAVDNKKLARALKKPREGLYEPSAVGSFEGIPGFIAETSTDFLLRASTNNEEIVQVLFRRDSGTLCTSMFVEGIGLDKGSHFLGRHPCV